MLAYFVHQVTASKQQDFAAPPSKEEWGGDQQVNVENQELILALLVCIQYFEDLITPCLLCI